MQNIGHCTKTAATKPIVTKASIDPALLEASFSCEPLQELSGDGMKGAGAAAGESVGESVG